MIDIDELLMCKIKENGGTQQDFDDLDKLIIQYSAQSGQPEESIALIIIDSLGCGMTKRDIETQFKIYDSKRSILIK